MTVVKKVLYGTFAILLTFGITNQVSTNSEENLVDKITKIEEDIITAKLRQEEKWMNEISCLARNVYYESRGESYEGQLAVAVVTLNRVKNSKFPNTICGVVNERKRAGGKVVCQFSWRCEGHTDPKKRVSQTHDSYQAAMDAIFEYEYLTQDFLTEDTLYFHAKHVKPRWRRHKQMLAKIDNHIFYKNKPGDNRR
jgi:spore germination cell wall hydrolase CwlJ-like protein